MQVKDASVRRSCGRRALRPVIAGPHTLYHTHLHSIPPAIGLSLCFLCLYFRYSKSFDVDVALQITFVREIR